MPATTTSLATTTSAATTTTTVTPAGWERVVPGGDCECALGGEFAYWVHRGDPTKVMLYFQGGGACFNADTCRPGSDAYKSSTGPEDDPSLRPAGLLALDDPRNPVAGWSIVFVPYCTGDVFLGNKTTQYAADVTINHKGAVDARAALDGLAAMFPDTTQLLVTGESAGGVPVPLVAGEAHDLLPNATITALADSSGAYPDVPIVNATIGSVWGTLDGAPAWPEFAGLTPEQYSIPGLFVLAGHHDPAIRFARHDYAFDSTQAFFGGLAGFDAEQPRAADRPERAGDRSRRRRRRRVRRAGHQPHRHRPTRALHRDRQRRAVRPVGRRPGGRPPDHRRPLRGLPVTGTATRPRATLHL